MKIGFWTFFLKSIFQDLSNLLRQQRWWWKERLLWWWKTKRTVFSLLSFGLSPFSGQKKDEIIFATLFFSSTLLLRKMHSRLLFFLQHFFISPAKFTNYPFFQQSGKKNSEMFFSSFSNAVKMQKSIFKRLPLHKRAAAMRDTTKSNTLNKLTTYNK